MIKEIKGSDRLLFFKYALPCAETLVKRKNLTEEELRGMLELVKKGKTPEKDCEKNFKVAMAHLTFLAIQKEKDKIDEEIIREYFLFNHDEAVDERYYLMGDFNPKNCRTYPGIVRKLEGDKASVETPLGIKPFRRDLVKNLKVNDIVVIHRNYAVEKISKEVASKMWDSKKGYIPNLKKNIFD